MDVLVPDIGDFKDVPVIEVLVKPGDEVQPEQSLITLESDKATMEVPSPAAGVVKEVKVKAGDKVSQGTLVCTLEEKGAGKEGKRDEKQEQEEKPAEKGKPSAERAASADKPAAPEQPVAASRGGREPSEVAEPEGAGKDAGDAGGGGQRGQPTPRKEHGGPTQTVPPPAHEDAAQAGGSSSGGAGDAHASPSVRKFARERGVDLGKVKGTGPKERILHEDVEAFVKSGLSAGAPAAAAAAAPMPKIDFGKFGPVEDKPLTRIQKIAGPNLLRNWNAIPHVTSCEDADITELEAFRVALNGEQKDVKVTLLAFVVKACIAALKKFPAFNSSLDGDHLVLKRYYNIAFAADTPQGLVVPVIKEADKKGVLAIAKETAELSSKAREGKLGPGDMQGATFTISSLGGIGGTYFTPIINAPEVAILGVCKAAMRPVWNGSDFVPRLMLPLSLSWDHRVVDGAAAGRFNAHLAAMLGDARRMLL
jgi:pyruvate dehydrogenase E2 component (dihydrolipoamide acetyltransferase)